MIRSTNTLEQTIDGPRRAQLEHAIDAPHIDAQFQTRRADQGIELPMAEVLLHLHPAGSCQGSVVDADAKVGRHAHETMPSDLRRGKRLLTKTRQGALSLTNSANRRMIA